MGAVLIEDELEFDFAAAIRAERFEDITYKMSHCMKSIDFIVEWDEELWFIEVKDPDNSKIPSKSKKHERRQFFEKFKSHTLFSKELGPKIKDSFLYLHLQKNLPDKPIKYYVLIAMKMLSPALLSSANDQLKISSCLLGPDNSAWPNKYLDGVAVFNKATWNEKLKQCPVTRNI
ncbi:MAG: hypothetical protein ABIK98_01380 [Pseudomonadota bacterium]